MTKLFLTMLNIGIKAGWLILAVLLLRVILRKAPRWTVCLLWGVVALRLVFPFSIESVFSLIPSAQTVPMEIERMEKPEVYTGIGFVDEHVNPVITIQMAPEVEESVNPMQIIIWVAALVWIVGIVLFQTYTLVSYMELRRKVRISIPFRSSRQQLPRQLEWGENPKIYRKIYVCDQIKSPFILGILNPKIYLPAGMNEAAYQNIIQHEATHLKRGDQFWKPLGYLLASVYWFQPLCWVAYVFFCKDMELACDERATMGMQKSEKASYCQTLLACSTNRQILAACPVAFGEVGVKERVKHVLNYKKPAFGIVLVACVVCIVTVVCFLTNPKVENGNGTQSVNGTEETAGTEATDVVSGTESGNTDIPESSDNVFEQSFGETEENQAYEQVLDEYWDMVQNRFYLDVLNTDEREKSFGPDIGSEIRMRVQNVFYALYDLDGNGTEELIIAAGEQGVGVGNPKFMPRNYDLYTYCDGKVIHVFDDYEFGYRTNFDLCENGVIEVSSNDSAAEFSILFFRLGADGASPVVLDGFMRVGKQIDDKTVVFQHYENGKEITEEEFNRKIEDYAKPLKGLEWQEIY